MVEESQQPVQSQGRIGRWVSECGVSRVQCTCWKARWANVLVKEGEVDGQGESAAGRGG